MIRVHQIEGFIESAVTRIAGLKKSLYVVNESNLDVQIKNLEWDEYPVLVSVLPTAKRDNANADNKPWMNSLLFFVLNRVERKNMTPKQELDNMDQMQGLTLELLDLMEEDAEQNQACNWLKRMDYSNVVIDPEYNYFNCDGWNMAVPVKSY